MLKNNSYFILRGQIVMPTNTERAFYSVLPVIASKKVLGMYLKCKITE